MDCLRFLPRNALGLVLSSESICKSSWAVWELTVAELHAQLRPGFKGHSFWSTSFSSRVSCHDVMSLTPIHSKWLLSLYPRSGILVYQTCPSCSAFSLSSKRLWPSKKKEVFLSLGSQWWYQWEAFTVWKTFGHKLAFGCHLWKFKFMYFTQKKFVNIYYSKTYIIDYYLHLLHEYLIRRCMYLYIYAHMLLHMYWFTRIHPHKHPCINTYTLLFCGKQHFLAMYPPEVD